MWYTRHRLHSWQGVQDQLENGYRDGPRSGLRWIFRGEYLDRVPGTKLEAAFDLYGITDPDRKKKCETWIIREFQRKASLYTASDPHKDDILEWLAIMQHHGALTRLLDFTYCFYVAVYFALAQTETGAVWAINVANNSHPIRSKISRRDSNLGSLVALWRKLHSMGDIMGIRKEGEKLVDLAIVHYLMRYPLRSVYPVSPFRLNKRLTAQQGLFLISGDITESFEENLRAYFDNDGAKMENSIHRIELVGSKSERREIIHRLKQMNISNESLFQDLDGFARSTRDFLAYPDLSG